MSFRVRKASLRDIEGFFELFKKSLQTQFPQYTNNTIRYFLDVDYRLSWLKEAITEKKRLVLIAETSKGEIIGYLFSGKPYGGVGFCNWVAVDDKYKKQGVGTALLNKWEDVMKKQGAHIVQLLTVERNIAFYKSRGYKLVGEIPDNYFGTNDHLFYKLLQKPKETNFLRGYLKKR